MKKIIFAMVVVFAVMAILPSLASAQSLPKVSISVDKSNSPQDLSVTLQILLFMTVLTLAPAIIILVTSFVRIVVVFAFLRQAIGTNQMPPNQLIIGLALILTAFIMAPTIERVNQTAIQPYMKAEMNQQQAYDIGIKPIRDFMLRQVREKDLALFVSMSHLPQPKTADDIPTYVLVPGYVISELRIAFQIGFILYIPFLIIDMVVASVLMSMGMLMLPPIMVSLPFKILLFVLVDGWYLIVKSLVESFR